MTERLIRFPIADPLQTALAAATELDRDQLEQLRDQVVALLDALPRPAAAPAATGRSERSPSLAGLPRRPRGGGSLVWKWIRQGDKIYGPYPYLMVYVGGGRRRSIYLKELAHAALEPVMSKERPSPNA